MEENKITTRESTGERRLKIEDLLALLVKKRHSTQVTYNHTNILLETPNSGQCYCFVYFVSLHQLSRSLVTGQLYVAKCHGKSFDFAELQNIYLLLDSLLKQDNGSGIKIACLP